MAREMKDSGVEWIGKIPSSWGCQQLKRIVSLMDARAEIHRNYIGLENVESWTGKRLHSNSAVHSQETTSLAFFPGDILFGKLRPYLAKCILVDESGECSTEFLVIRPSEFVQGKYLQFILVSASFIDIVSRATYGVKMPRANWEIVGYVRVPLPPLPEQKRIADFLDSKCAKIDEILDKTRASIEEYKKLKQAIITEAVTKGVRGKRPMKPSGIEWIGEIPEEWKVEKLKYHMCINNGSDPKSEGEVPVYGSGSESFKTCGEFKEGPTVLLGRKGATLHIPHFIIGRYWNVDTAFDVKAISEYNLKFFYYVASCFDYEFYKSQTTLPSMTQTAYENMLIPVPTKTEQAEVVGSLDQKCEAIDSIILKNMDFITEMEGYRKSLIYEYVTGKKEVAS